MFKIDPEISEELILSRISEEQLFDYYFPGEISFRKIFRSPLRNDKKPTCNIYKNKNGRLILKDFAGGPGGNIFHVLMYRYNIGYWETLEKINKDLKLIDNKVWKKTLNEEILKIKSSTEKVTIRIKKQDFTPTDIAYWDQYELYDKELLERFEVNSVSHVWLNNRENGELELKSIYNPKNPIYSYYYMNGDYKIYFPLSTYLRFLCNTNKLAGYNQLPSKGDLLVWTKSHKDVMMYTKLGYNAVAVQGETQFPDKIILDELKSRFSKHIINYDPDAAGISGRNKLVTLTGWNYFEFQEGKDVSGYCKIYKSEKTKQLLDKIIK
jgi:hypothetical protein